MAAISVFGHLQTRIQAQGSAAIKVLARVSMQLAQFAISAALFLALIAAWAFFEETRFRSAIEAPLAIPGYLAISASWIRAGVAYVASDLGAFSGAYMAMLGFLLSGCELLAAQRRCDVREMCLTNMKKHSRSLFSFVYTLLILWALSIIIMLKFSSGKYFVNRYLETHPSASLGEIYKAGIQFEWAHISYLVAPGAILLPALTLLFVLWSFGFWGILAALMSVSRFAARALGLRAYVPIASILLGLAGLIFAL